jgi:thiopurine S-methyltransferase
LCLITIEFPRNELEGPPFPVFAEDVHTLFNNCQIDCIASRELADKRFAQRTFQVSHLVERLYFITQP